MNFNTLNGKQINEYIFERLIGQGAFGKIYLAHHSISEEIVAIKVIELQRFEENDGILGELVQQEIQGLKQVHSKNIVKFIDNFQDGIFNYLVMEYCDSGDLEQQLNNKNTKLTEKDAIAILKQILCGLKEMHSKFIVHRDLKMSNILIHNKSIYKIADLGFCKILNNPNEKTCLQLGSNFTMAPEIYKGEPYGLQSDIFSVGIIFYYILYRRYPFKVHQYQKKEQAIINFQENSIKVSEDTQTLLKNMLQFNPLERITFAELSNVKLGDETFSVISKIQFQSQQIDLSQNIEFYKNNSDQIEFQANQNFERLKTKVKSQDIQIEQQIQNFDNDNFQNLNNVEIQNKQNEIFDGDSKESQYNGIIIQQYIQYKNELDILTSEFNKQLNRVFYITNTIKQIVQVQAREHYLMAMLCIKACIMIQKIIQNHKEILNQIQNYPAQSNQIKEEFKDLNKLQNFCSDLYEVNKYQKEDIVQQLIQSGEIRLQMFNNNENEDQINNELSMIIYDRINKQIQITQTYYHIMQCGLFIQQKESKILDVNLEETFCKSKSNEIIQNQQEELQQFNIIMNQYQIIN